MATDFSSKETLLIAKHELELKLLELKHEEELLEHAYRDARSISVQQYRQERRKIELTALQRKQTAERLAVVTEALEEWERNNANKAPTEPPSRRSVVEPLLRKKGWSILDWAQEAGVADHTARDYLDGKKNPYRSTRVKLARALDIPESDLYQ